MKTPSPKRTYYLAIYEAEEGGAWTSFADFDCLIDQGETVEDAIKQSTIFLESVLEDRVAHGEQCPEPSEIHDFIRKLDPEDGTPLCIVPVTVFFPTKTVRVNITGKDAVFAQIDDYAKWHHMTRSELMINATLNHIAANP